MYGIRLKQLIVDEHEIKIKRTFTWTDSKTVWHWLHVSDNKRTMFVATRVADILDS